MTPTERAARIHEGIKSAFLARGGSEEQWARVAAAPHKFNRVWRRLLSLPEGTTPPPDAWRNIDPSAGERLEVS